MHPLSVAHKTNFIFTGSSIHLFYLTPLDCEPMCASEGPALQHHLLLFGLDINALMFLNRSIDEDFMNFVAKNKQLNSIFALLVTNPRPRTRLLRTALPTVSTPALSR